MTDRFIAVYDDVFDDEFCASMIQTFKDAEELGFTFDRKSQYYNGNHVEDDATKIPYFPASHCNKKRIEQFNDIFWNVCYRDYAERFPILNNLGNHIIHGIKIQKSIPSQGYHIWHCEQSDLNSSSRLMAWTVYLNDVEEGGETEFLYQFQRVKAERGRVVIFPASYTYAHRGNPPLKGDKYIMTGWVEF